MTVHTPLARPAAVLDGRSHTPPASAPPEVPPSSAATAGERDLALDVIRAAAVGMAVVNHLPLVAPYQWAANEGLGAVTGADLLVLVSGVVVGSVHRGRLADRGWRASAGALWRRSLALYRASVGVVLVLWTLGALGVWPRVLTTWTDEETGAVRPALPPASLAAAWDLALLRVAPWQINILGLYVAFTALAPLALWALARGRWALLLAGSWGVYAVATWLRLRPTGAAFEASFPLLVWQLPFVHALAVGFHRGELAARLAGPPERWLLAAAATVAGAFALLAWPNPWSAAPPWTRLSILPARAYGLVWATAGPDRAWFGPGRLLDAASVVYLLHAALTGSGAARSRAARRFLVPVGQASLYVFIVHLAVVAVVDVLPLPRRDDLVLNTLVHSAALVLLWGCVRSRLLFRWIPR